MSIDNMAIIKVQTAIWIVCICLLGELLGELVSGQSSELTTKISRKISKLERTLNGIEKMVEELFESRDECTEMLANHTRGTGLLGSVYGQVSILSALEEETAEVIGVRVPYTYRECLQDLADSSIPPNNARVWCLRVALWQFKRDVGSDDFDSDDAEVEMMDDASLDDEANFAEEKDIRVAAANVVREAELFLDSADWVCDRRFLRRLAPRNIEHPRTGFRTRREYRTLSAAERGKFHDAMNHLRDLGAIQCFAKVHRMAVRRGGAHDGHAFLPWHRAFLSLFEEALRKIDPSVSLPYWDSTLDDNMAAGPGFSVMWDNQHLGTGKGVVDEGPFAGWESTEGPLQRNIASGKGSLVRQSRIDQLMSYCRFSEFARRWENTHNNVHNWVGGTMASSMSSADPVFYMHHAFVDYQWEKFRERQSELCGIDPTSDYPPNDPDKPEHDNDDRMTGMPFLRNEAGIADYWTKNWYNYEDKPSCDNNCGDSLDLFCDDSINLCVSDVRYDFEDDIQALHVDIRRKRRTVMTYDEVIHEGGKPFTAACKKNPYLPNCPGENPPMSKDDMIQSYIFSFSEENGAPSNGLKRAFEENKQELKKAESIPPENEASPFPVSEDEYSDCRTAETSKLNLISAVVTGRKVTQKKERALAMANRPGNSKSNGSNRGSENGNANSSNRANENGNANRSDRGNEKGQGKGRNEEKSSGSSEGRQKGKQSAASNWRRVG